MSAQVREGKEQCEDCEWYYNHEEMWNGYCPKCLNTHVFTSQDGERAVLIKTPTGKVLSSSQFAQERYNLLGSPLSTKDSIQLTLIIISITVSLLLLASTYKAV